MYNKFYKKSIILLRFQISRSLSTNLTSPSARHSSLSKVISANSDEQTYITAAHRHPQHQSHVRCVCDCVTGLWGIGEGLAYGPPVYSLTQ